MCVGPGHYICVRCRRLAHLYAPSSRYPSPKASLVFDAAVVAHNVTTHVDVWGNATASDRHDSAYSDSTSEHFSSDADAVRKGDAFGAACGLRTALRREGGTRALVLVLIAWLFV